MKNLPKKPRSQTALPGEIQDLHASQKTSLSELSTEIKKLMGSEWLPEIYKTRVLPLRTRAHRIGEASRSAAVEIQYTLLGVELKIGRRRLMCPDLPTARYLASFARLGCGEVAVPYDITKVSHLADELESSWHRMLLLVDHVTSERGLNFRSRLSRGLQSEARHEINELGAGSQVPQFNQNTKQRPAAPRSAA